MNYMLSALSLRLLSLGQLKRLSLKVDKFLVVTVSQLSTDLVNSTMIMILTLLGKVITMFCCNKLVNSCSILQRSWWKERSCLSSALISSLWLLLKALNPNSKLKKISTPTLSCSQLYTGKSICYSRRLLWRWMNTFLRTRMFGMLSMLLSLSIPLNSLRLLVMLGWLNNPLQVLKRSLILKTRESWVNSSLYTCLKQLIRTLVLIDSEDSLIVNNTNWSELMFSDFAANSRMNIFLCWTPLLLLISLFKLHSVLLMVMFTTDTLDYSILPKTLSRDLTGGEKFTRLTRSITSKLMLDSTNIHNNNHNNFNNNHTITETTNHSSF